MIEPYQSLSAKFSSPPKILILGAGPTGLGAAHRLEELGHTDYLILEKNDYAGGLAASFTDPKGFTWDIGGHVQFSHYEYFDDLMYRALGEEWLEHLREAYVWILDRFVPYPFQNNLRHLPKHAIADCILGLIREEKQEQKIPLHFKDWLQSSFGEGIAKLFLFPYNFKVWAYPLEMMSYSWIGERVSRINIEKVLENVLLEKDDRQWGPNNKFRFPLIGGTGAIWRSLAAQLPKDKLIFNSEVRRIDAQSKTVKTSNGKEYTYDVLISSAPIDILSRWINDKELIQATAKLCYSTVHVVGIGFKGTPCNSLQKKCWMYFPESNCPFYRVTLFSNYSYNNVPDKNHYWSLMAEISESQFKQVNRETIVAEVLEGMYATKLACPEDEVVSQWLFTAPYGYPTPSIERDSILDFVQPKMENEKIFSRGRFGGWKYEVSNQDHTCMQGVEVVNRILLNKAEITYPSPSQVNNRPGQVSRNESMGK